MQYRIKQYRMQCNVQGQIAYKLSIDVSVEHSVYKMLHPVSSLGLQDTIPRYDTIRDATLYFNARSKSDISQLNL